MRLVGGDEVDGELAALEPAELTRAGLVLVAARLGLRLSEAVHHHGLAGGGPADPIGARRQLLRTIAHTRGVDGIFVRLHREGALVEWRNAAACARGAVRPDGYGVVRGQERPAGFFLEYDRGTMRARDYRRKFAGYHAYCESGRFRRDYDGFPTILVVTTGPGAEERIARAVRATGVEREPPLPVLLTTEGWIDGQPEGLLGPIWRTPDSPARRRWPSVLDSFAGMGATRALKGGTA